MEIYWEWSLGPLHWERRALALDHEEVHTVKPLDPVFPLLLLPLSPGASLCVLWYLGMAPFGGL